MAKRTRSKRGVAAEDGSKGHHNEVETPRPTLRPFPPQSGSGGPAHTLNITAFPHILTSIMDLASTSTLAAFMTCSKYTNHIAAPRLYRHVRTTSSQFSALITAGTQPASGSSGALSPYLRESFKHIRPVNLRGYRPSKAEIAPPIELSCPDLSTLVIHPTVHWRNNDTSNFSWPPSDPGVTPLLLQADKRALKARNVFVILSESFVTFWNRCLMSISDLPDHVLSVTLLIPCAWRTEMFPTCYPEWEAGAGSGKCLTIVLLPGTRQRNEVKWWDRPHMWEIFMQWPIKARCQPNLAIRVVGTEYTGAENPHRHAILDRLPHPRLSPSFVRFLDWLDEIEPGTIFTAEEEARLRADDKHIMAEQVEDADSAEEQGHQ